MFFIDTHSAIAVLSRYQAEFIKFSPDDYVISITDPRQNLANIKGTDHILRLQFFDIEEGELINGVAYEPMTKEDADNVAQFVSEKPDRFSLFVHCEAGISRSAGVAAAIAKHFFGDDNFFFEHKIPNKHCYRMVLNALEEYNN